MEINVRLLKSCKTGDLEGIEYALKAGADINYMGDDSPFTPIETCANHKHHRAIEFLVKNDVLVSDTSIIIAIDHRELTMVKALFQGNLSDVDWGAVFRALDQGFEHNDKEDKELVEIYQYIVNHLRTSMAVLYRLRKEMDKGLEIFEKFD